VSSIATSAASSRWLRSSKTVAASSTESIYTKSLTSFRAQKVIMSVFNTDEALFHGREIFISRKSADVKHTVYNKLGDKIDFILSISVVGADVTLSIQNTEVFPIDVVLFRLDVS